MKCHVGITWKNSMTMATAMSEKAKFTSANKTFCTGKIYRLTLTFFSSGAALMILVSAALVESLMSENVTLPTMR